MISAFSQILVTPLAWQRSVKYIVNEIDSLQSTKKGFKYSVNFYKNHKTRCSEVSYIKQIESAQEYLSITQTTSTRKELNRIIDKKTDKNFTMEITFKIKESKYLRID